MDTAEAYQARREAERRAGMEINHFGSYQAGEKNDMCDYWACSCGWKSNGYSDGADLAQAEWVKHIQEHGAELNYPRLVLTS